MEDAPNEVKAASTAVVSSSMECGLAEALEKFVFQ
jgi:hydroxymethylpyrimidine pyrophosphatase-like HAD family hydrolase